MIKAIAAVNNKNYIGKDGKLPWHSTDDFTHFKTMTKGGICIVGQRTYEIDMGGKGLPGRTMYVIGPKYLTPYEAFIQASEQLTVRLENDLMDELAESQKCIWVIGGNTIYKQFFPFINEFHLSHINDETIGDVQLELDWTKFRGKLEHYYFEVNK